MNRLRTFKFTVALAVAGLVLRAPAALACAACFGGKTDSPLAAGMNWGIFSLLAVIGTVLGGVASFFVYLAKRSATATAPVPAPAPEIELPAATQKA